LNPKFKLPYPLPHGVILHEGATLTGHPFVAIATLQTVNRKTGDMVQIWFLLKDVNPVEAVQSGLDASTICRSCPFASGNGCYVNVGQAPLAIWKAYHRGNYPVVEPHHYQQLFRWRKVRFGAYGNPTLLPLSKVRAIARYSKGWTGYFHDWQDHPLAEYYAQYFMASTETKDSLRMAKALGFRTFHASPEQPTGSVECLADADGRTCADCLLCQGGSKAQAKNIWINPHGSRVNRAKEVAMTEEPTYEIKV
jgi:hypothetical protein